MADKELDGIICVNMLGEGVDFPNLKIAAVHAPHKSLAITLQFIGRFARTNAPDIGPAKFLAEPSDISLQAERLYEEGAIWQTIVPDLLEAEVQKEVRVREVFSTFTVEEEWDEEVEADLSDLSMYGLRPYHHVKVFEVDGAVEIDSEIAVPPPMTVVRRYVSREHSMAVLITKETTRPRWTHSDLLASVEYDLFRHLLQPGRQAALYLRLAQERRAL